MLTEEFNEFIKTKISLEKDNLAPVLSESISKAFSETAKKGFSRPCGFTNGKIIEAYKEYIYSFSDIVWDTHVIAVKAFNLSINESLKKDLRESLEKYLPQKNINWHRAITSRMGNNAIPEQSIQAGNQTIEKYIYGAYIQKVKEIELFITLLKQQKMIEKDSNSSGSTTIINNISGTNSRLNINSTDSSTNINRSSDEVFSKLIELISENIDLHKDKELLLNKTQELKTAYGTESFCSVYQEFMSIASNHITVLAPVLPALAGMLGG